MALTNAKSDDSMFELACEILQGSGKNCGLCLPSRRYRSTVACWHARGGLIRNEVAASRSDVSYRQQAFCGFLRNVERALGLAARRSQVGEGRSELTVLGLDTTGIALVVVGQQNLGAGRAKCLQQPTLGYADPV